MKPNYTAIITSISKGNYPLVGITGLTETSKGLMIELHALYSSLRYDDSASTWAEIETVKSQLLA